MEERYIAAAVPLFFLLIGFELWAQRRRGRAKYRFHDSIASLSCGVGQQTLNLGLTAVFLGAYSALFERFALFRVSPSSPLGWAVLLFAVDLSYYALHRADHRVNVLWAGHAVHHQSEEYNLSTALRQSWLEALLGTPFYLPLAVLGFPPVMFATMLTVNTLYQFWIHTRSVGKLGALEGIINTPSAHRVHHGVDPQYIDKNYGGMLSIWDRLFGTYEPEGVEPIYGTVKPLASHNPLWANVAEWARLWEMARATRRAGTDGCGSRRRSGGRRSGRAGGGARGGSRALPQIRRARAARGRRLCIRPFRGGDAPGDRAPLVSHDDGARGGDGRGHLDPRVAGGVERALREPALGEGARALQAGGGGGARGVARAGDGVFPAGRERDGAGGNRVGGVDIALRRHASQISPPRHGDTEIFNSRASLPPWLMPTEDRALV